MCVFLNAFCVPAQKRAFLRSKVQSNGRTLLWVYAPNYIQKDGFSVDAISDITGIKVARRAGEGSAGGTTPIALTSNTTVTAYGARFRLPETLGDKARVVLFVGENVSDFRWFGGHFCGHVFDNKRADNTWEPNANTRGILITTTDGGTTENLTFREITADNMAGAVITVFGASKSGSESEVATYARNVTVENCTLQRSGKFMWDYGYLWQITVWPEDYSEAERAMAAKHFRNDLVRDAVQMAAGDDRVMFDNARPPPVTATDAGGRQAVCFYGDTLPANLVRGRQYFVVADNIFINNTTKSEEDPQLGRRSYINGAYEHSAELYFTTYEPEGRYGNVSIRGNLFITGERAAHAITFAPGGDTILVTDNIFRGPVRSTPDALGCENVTIRDNEGAVSP